MYVSICTSIDLVFDVIHLPQSWSRLTSYESSEKLDVDQGRFEWAKLALERTRKISKVDLRIIEGAFILGNDSLPKQRTESLAQLVQNHLESCRSITVQTHTRELVESMFPLQGPVRALRKLDINLLGYPTQSSTIEIMDKGVECQLTTLSLATDSTPMSLSNIDPSNIIELDFDGVFVAGGNPRAIVSFIQECQVLQRLRWSQIDPLRSTDLASFSLSLPHVRVLEIHSLLPLFGMLVVDAPRLKHLVLQPQSLLGSEETAIVPPYQIFPSLLTLSFLQGWCAIDASIHFLQRHPSLVALEVPADLFESFIECMAESQHDFDHLVTPVYENLQLIHARDRRRNPFESTTQEEIIRRIGIALPTLFELVPDVRVELACKISAGTKKLFRPILKRWPYQLVFIDPSEPRVSLSDRFDTPVSPYGASDLRQL